MDRDSEKNLIHFKFGGTVLAFSPLRKINFHAKRDVAMHAHSVFEFHTLYDGEAKIDTEHNCYAFHAGNIALIPPNTYHAIENITDSFSLRSFTFSLLAEGKRKDYLQHTVNLLLDAIQRTDVIILKGLSAVMWIIDHLYDEISNDSLLGTRYVQDAYSTVLFVMLLRSIFSEQQLIARSSNQPKLLKSFIEPDRANQIEMYFADYYVDGNIKQLARFLSLSAQHVRRILLAHYGMPFSQIINKHRVNVSKQLLRNTDLSITKIWWSVGFRTPQNFHIAFRKYAGCTPSQYRAKLSVPDQSDSSSFV